MSLRWKITAALMLLGGLSAITIGVTTYLTTDHELTRVIDRSLDDTARLRVRFADPGRVMPPGSDDDADDDGVGRGFPGAPDRPRGYDQVVVQVLDRDGNIVSSPDSGALPVTDADRAIARSGGQRARRSDLTVDDEPYRALTVATSNGAVQLARNVSENERALDGIRDRTLLAVVIVMGLAVLLGSLIGSQITRRLRRLTESATEVASTGRLDIAVPTGGTDETGQLGRAFSGMLSALAGSRAQQQQLIQDAGHELRTPLTSLRTNVSVLRRFDSLAPEERTRMIADLDSETRELTALVNELVELATDRRDDEPLQIVRLGDVAERAAARTRRRSGREITFSSDDGFVDVRPLAIERAIQNLVDNAVKFAPEGPVEVHVAAGRLSVRDHGAGIPHADLPHVFDRFYRSVESRSLPGSGLGLAIVKSIVEQHGGTVFAGHAEGGGATIGFHLPTVELPPDT